MQHPVNPVCFRARWCSQWWIPTLLHTDFLGLALTMRFGELGKILKLLCFRGRLHPHHHRVCPSHLPCINNQYSRLLDMEYYDYDRHTGERRELLPPIYTLFDSLTLPPPPQHSDANRSIPPLPVLTNPSSVQPALPPPVTPTQPQGPDRDSPEPGQLPCQALYLLIMLTKFLRTTLSHLHYPGV